MGLIKRFEANNRQAACAVLRKLPVFAECPSAAADLCRMGELVAFSTGEALIRQGDDDNDIFYLLAGSVEVQIQNAVIGPREAPQHVGEMSLIDPSAKRSATVTAKTEVIALKVSEPIFRSIAATCPELWRNLACELADRLRRRADTIPIPNSKPRIFVASSSEAKLVVDKLTRSLKGPTLDIVPWDKGVFGLSDTGIESLESEARRCDLAIIIATKDDMKFVRGAKRHAPRDNVIFESGLMIGAIARQRTILLVEKGAALPSDLNGVTYQPFSRQDDAEFSTTMKAATKAIKQAITTLGVR